MLSKFKPVRYALIDGEFTYQANSPIHYYDEYTFLRKKLMRAFK